MSITFPAIKPAARTFTAGTYPTKSYRSLAGTTVKRSFGNKPAAYQFSASFRNVTDAVSAQILQHYETTAAGFERFALPPALFVGMSATLIELVRAPKGIRWEYAAPPELESVYVNLSNISVQFTGEINV
jgi:hypothetical protein